MLQASFARATPSSRHPLLLTQDITQKLCEALSTSARASILQDYAIVEKTDAVAPGEDRPPHAQLSHPVPEEEKTGSLTSGDSDKKGEIATRGADATRDKDSSPASGERKDDSASISGSSSSSSGVTEEAEMQAHTAAAARQSASGGGGSPLAPATSQKSGVSAASVRAGIGSSGRLNQVHTPPLTVVAKQQPVSMDQQMPAIQALAVLANVSTHMPSCITSSLS